MAGFGDAHIVVKVAFICIAVAFLLHLIGFASPYWVYRWLRVVSTGRTYLILRHDGLWRLCYTDCTSFTTIPSWLESVQAFETIGFIGAIGTLLLCILYIFVGKVAGNKIVAILNSLFSLGSAGFILLGVFIYLGETPFIDNVSWALVLSTFGGILFGVAGALLIVGICKGRTN